MSLRAAGDCGPSGGPGARAHQRVASLVSLPTPVFIPRQVHSLTLVELRRGAIPMVHRGSWIENRIVVEHASAGLPEIPEAPDESQFARLAEQVGAMEADGIMTDLPITIGATVADCLPVFIRWGRWRALLHSGWQGTGIVRIALDALHDALSPEEVTSPPALVLGPSVAAVDYPVDQERAELFARRFGQASVIEDKQSGTCLAIGETNIALIESWAAEQAFGSDLSIHWWTNSTVSSPWLQSYRRDGADFGRMLVLSGEKTSTR